MVLLRKKEMPAIGWFALPLGGIMGMQLFMRTYLVEVAFGAAIIVGVAMEDLVAGLAELPLKRLPRTTRYLLTVVVLTLCAGMLAFFLANVATKFEALRIVSATRCNFRDAVEFVARIAAPRPKHLIVVAYDEMGDGYRNYVDSLSDLGKAHLQKTMQGFQLDVFMVLISPNMPVVHNLKWLETGTERKGLVLLSMNNAENKFIQGLGLRTEVLYESQRRGEKATVYRIEVPIGWSLPENRTRAQRPQTDGRRYKPDF
jgi:hypothetical protein